MRTYNIICFRIEIRKKSQKMTRHRLKKVSYLEQYDNTPIQIYIKIHLQKTETFSDKKKSDIFFILLLKR